MSDGRDDGDWFRLGGVPHIGWGYFRPPRTLHFGSDRRAFTGPSGAGVNHLLSRLDSVRGGVYKGRMLSAGKVAPNATQGEPEVSGKSVRGRRCPATVARDAPRRAHAGSPWEPGYRRAVVSLKVRAGAPRNRGRQIRRLMEGRSLRHRRNRRYIDNRARDVGTHEARAPGDV